jgi:hypothetical protein
MDINTFNFKQVNCDVFFAVSVLYHFGAERFEQIIKDISEKVSEVILMAQKNYRYYFYVCLQ